MNYGQAPDLDKVKDTPKITRAKAEPAVLITTPVKTTTAKAPAKIATAPARATPSKTTQKTAPARRVYPK
jgi:hypothetical protein